MIVNVLIVFILFYCVSSVLAIRNVADNIEIKLKKDKNAAVHIVVRNKGICPVSCCKVTVKVQNIITGIEDSFEFYTWLKSKNTRTLDFTIKDNLCGCIRVYSDGLVISDMLGIFKKKIKSDSEIKLYSWPLLYEIPISKESADRYDMESFRYSQYRKGNDSSDTFGISQYREGDSVKAIHWKLSAKTGDIMIRDYSFPVDNRIMILVDKKEYQDLELSPEDKSKSTEFALSLSQTIIRKGIEHSIGWYDIDREAFIVKSVKTAEDINLIIPEFLESLFYGRGNDVITGFIESDSEKNYSGFILVTDGKPETERLMEYGEVDLYRPEIYSKDSSM